MTFESMVATNQPDATSDTVLVRWTPQIDDSDELVCFAIRVGTFLRSFVIGRKLYIRCTGSCVYALGECWICVVVDVGLVGVVSAHMLALVK